jgi:hypothetical protein
LDSVESSTIGVVGDDALVSDDDGVDHGHDGNHPVIRLGHFVQHAVEHLERGRRPRDVVNEDNVDGRHGRDRVLDAVGAGFTAGDDKHRETRLGDQCANLVEVRGRSRDNYFRRRKFADYIESSRE